MAETSDVRVVAQQAVQPVRWDIQVDRVRLDHCRKVHPTLTPIEHGREDGQILSTRRSYFSFAT